MEFKFVDFEMMAWRTVCAVKFNGSALGAVIFPTFPALFVTIWLVIKREKVTGVINELIDIE